RLASAGAARPPARRAPPRRGRGRRRGSRWRTSSAPSLPSAASAAPLRVLEVLDQSRRDEQPEDDAHEDDPQRRLGEQPPEALPVRVEQRDPIRLDERPDDAAEARRRPERPDDADAPGSLRPFRL